MTTVAITGVGCVTPLGIGRQAYSAAVHANCLGVSDLTLFAPPGACEHAAEVWDYEWDEYIFSRQTYADRCTKFAAGAARLALDDAGISLPVESDGEPIGLIFGSCWGAFSAVEKFYEPLLEGRGKRASSLVFSHSYPNSPTSLVAIEFGLRGYSTSFTGSPLAGLWTLRSAFDAIQSQTAGRILIGASEALNERVFAHLEATGALPPTGGMTPPETVSTAEDYAFWSRIPGEGSVFLMLEPAARAQDRKTKIYGTIESITDTEDGQEACGGSRCGDGLALNGLLALVECLLAGEVNTPHEITQRNQADGMTVRVIC